MRKQYHFRPADEGLDAWDVDRLIRLTKDLPVVDVPLHSIRDLDTPYWMKDPDAPHASRARRGALHRGRTRSTRRTP
jgi:hypothetical protein